MKRMLRWAVLLGLLPLSALAQDAPITGILHTTDVDLAYWVYGKPTSQMPVIAVNGGPDLSHIYMIQNDVWNRWGPVMQALPRWTRRAASCLSAAEAKIGKGQNGRSGNPRPC